MEEKPKRPAKIKGTNKYNIDDTQVEKLASKFWTYTEIAAFFNVNEGTIRKGYSEIVAKGREVGKSKLRDLQLNSAMKGNVTMQIWLGKQYLGQSDKSESTNYVMSNEEFKKALEEKFE